jgi:hypothetical protein
MTTQRYIVDVVELALTFLPPKMTSANAKAELYTIGYQESEFEHRVQIGNGPARGFWQNERTGGVRGIMNHAAVRDLTKKLCVDRDCNFDSYAIWNRMAEDDVFAAACARLLLWTDPKPLPSAYDCAELPENIASVAEQTESWKLYARVWRPGKPHPKKWVKNRRRAVELLEL